MQGLLITGCAFIGIAMMTFFFSSRRRLFIRFFVMPQEGAKDCIRGLATGKDFQVGFRAIAALQAIAGVAMLIVWFVSRFA